MKTTVRKFPLLKLEELPLKEAKIRPPMRNEHYSTLFKLCLQLILNQLKRTHINLSRLFCAGLRALRVPNEWDPSWVIR